MAGPLIARTIGISAMSRLPAENIAGVVISAPDVIAVHLAELAIDVDVLVVALVVGADTIEKSVLTFALPDHGGEFASLQAADDILGDVRSLWVLPAVAPCHRSGDAMAGACLGLALVQILSLDLGAVFPVLHDTVARR